MRSMKRLAVIVATVTTGVVTSLASPAVAADAGVIGVSDVIGTVGGVTFSGHCQYEYGAVGVGGGGATYAVEAAGTAVGAAVRDTKVACTVYKDAIGHGYASAFLPGFAAATAGTFNSNSLAAGLTCVQVFAFLDSGATVASPRVCS